MAYPNRHRLYPILVHRLDIIRAHYRACLTYKGITCYRLCKNLNARGHKLTQGTMSRFLSGKYLPEPDVLRLIYSEIGLKYPDDVLTTFSPEDSYKVSGIRREKETL
jgi:hypothetical protein